MRLSNAVLFSIVCSLTAVNADHELYVVNSQSMVKRSDAEDIMHQISTLNSITNKKRELAADDMELVELDKRATDALSNLIVAFANSGIISAVSSSLTSDPALSSALSTLVQSAISGLLTQAPSLISAIWNSGLLGKLLSIFLNDSDLSSAILQVGGDVIGAVITLVEQYFAGPKSSATPAAASAPTYTLAYSVAATTAATTKAATTAASTKAATTGVTSKAATTGAITSYAAATASVTGGNILNSLASKYLKREEAPQMLDERDTASLVTSAVQAISDSGLLSNFVTQILSDPSASTSFLTSALNDGVVGAEDIYNWAKSSGVLDQFLSWFEANAPSVYGEFTSLLGGALGSVPASGASGVSAAPAASAAPTASAATTLLTKRMLY